MDGYYLPEGFVSTDVETVELKSDLEISVGNLLHMIATEKQKAWKEGFAAAVRTYEESK